VLTPLTVKNYGGSCGFVPPPVFESPTLSYRLREQKESLSLLLDSEKKPYLHLIDGGVADNLGLRTIQESVDAVGNVWQMMKLTGKEKVRKVVFVVVMPRDENRVSVGPVRVRPPFSAMLSNYSTIAIVRYNRETMSILEESFGRWASQIRAGRCPPGLISREPGSCGDIEFYLVDGPFRKSQGQAEAVTWRNCPRLSGYPRGRRQIAGRCAQASERIGRLS
jgi:NTE family protein